MKDNKKDNKKIDQNDYLEILSEYNTFWFLIDGKTFRSVDWIWYFYKLFEPIKTIYFDATSAQSLENFRRQGFLLETDISKKKKKKIIVYTSIGVYRTLANE